MMDFQFYVEHVNVSSSAPVNAFLHHRFSLVARCNGGTGLGRKNKHVEKHTSFQITSQTSIRPPATTLICVDKIPPRRW
jgi:hypothetical protein